MIFRLLTAFILGFVLARAGDALGERIQKYVDSNCTGLIYERFQECKKRQQKLLLIKKILTWTPLEESRDKTPND